MHGRDRVDLTSLLAILGQDDQAMKDLHLDDTMQQLPTAVVGILRTAERFLCSIVGDLGA